MSLNKDSTVQSFSTKNIGREIHKYILSYDAILSLSVNPTSAPGLEILLLPRGPPFKNAPLAPHIPHIKASRVGRKRKKGLTLVSQL